MTDRQRLWPATGAARRRSIGRHRRRPPLGKNPDAELGDSRRCIALADGVDSIAGAGANRGAGSVDPGKAGARTHCSTVWAAVACGMLALFAFIEALPRLHFSSSPDRPGIACNRIPHRSCTGGEPALELPPSVPTPPRCSDSIGANSCSVCLRCRRLRLPRTILNWNVFRAQTAGRKQSRRCRVSFESAMTRSAFRHLE